MLKKSSFYQFLLFLLLFVALAGTAVAKSTTWKGDFGNLVRLVIAQKQGDNLTAGIEFQTPPKHHTYWRNPGEVGYASVLNFAGSYNIKSHSIKWPVPKRYDEDGFNTHGYETNQNGRNFILPVDIKLEDGTAASNIKLNFFGAVCHVNCFPVQQDFELNISPENFVNTTDIAAIDYFAKQVPTGNSGDIKTVAFDGTTLKAVTNSSVTDLFVDANPQFESILFSIPKLVSQSAGKKTWEINFYHADERKKLKLDDLEKFNINLTSKGSAASTQSFKAKQGVVFGEQPKAAKPTPQDRSLFVYIIFALIGGLILNLMPCVLPVLSIKAFSFLNHQGEDKKVIKNSFLFSALGIIATFLALGAIASAVQLAGSLVVWGQHFQYVWVILAFILALTIFAANLFGLLEFRLPAWVSDNSLKHNEHSNTGSFMTGVFATLLATPCTAPLLGTAIGFALSKGVLEIMLISLFVGIGMALPYLLFVFFPSLIKFLPKPGAWMGKLKIFLGLLVLLTALWLTWFVLYPSNGYIFAIIVTICIFGILLRLWGNYKNNLFAKVFSVFGSIAAILFSLYILPEISDGDPFASENKVAPIKIVKFEPEKIVTYVASGKTVFLDITADWCATCKVNKSLVLDTEDINKLLAEKNVIFMQGDMTKPDRQILLYLKQWGRAGIPFNAVFGPSRPEGVLLSEILTQSAVKEAFAAAK